jgi:hypothetical protein
MLSTELRAVGPKNASRIWGFMSKFVMLDRFIKALGAADAHAGFCVPRDACLLQGIGTADKVSISLPNYMALPMGLSDPR